MIVTTTFERKTFRVQAVRVTQENMGELAEWCGGAVVNADRHPDDVTQYIEVETTRMSGSKSHAWVGDWIARLSADHCFRIYRDKSFLEVFQEVSSESRKREKIMDLLAEFLVDQQSAMSQADLDAAFDSTAGKLINLI